MLTCPCATFCHIGMESKSCSDSQSFLKKIAVWIFVERIAAFEMLKLDQKIDVPNRKKKFFFFWWCLFKLIMQIQKTQDIRKVLVKLSTLEMGNLAHSLKKKIQKGKLDSNTGIAKILMCGISIQGNYRYISGCFREVR